MQHDDCYKMKDIEELIKGGLDVYKRQEDNLSVNADPEKLARVFSNLLRNAASYSYPQTEITIFAKRLELSLIHILSPILTGAVTTTFFRALAHSKILAFGMSLAVLTLTIGDIPPSTRTVRCV